MPCPSRSSTTVPAVPVAQRLMAAHRAPCAVACGTERKLHALLRPGQYVRSSAHAAADQHRLTGIPQLARQIGMPRSEGARGTLAMHVEFFRAPVHLVFFHFAGVVRHVIQQRQPRLRQHLVEYLGEYRSRQVGEYLAVGQRAIDRRAHRAEIVLSERRIDRRTGQLAVGQARCHSRVRQSPCASKILCRSGGRARANRNGC